MYERQTHLARPLSMPLTTDFIDLVTVFILTAVSRRDATASILEASRRQFNAYHGDRISQD